MINLRRSFSKSLKRISKRNKTTRRRRLHNAVRPMMEQLEDRRLLAVTVLNSAASTGNAATTETISGFNVPAGNDLALVVLGSGYGLLSSVTFGGQSFSFVAAEGDALPGGFGSLDVSIWIALLGDRGSPTTANVVSNWSVDGPNNFKRISAIALSGVDQTTPTSGAMSDDTFSSPQTLNITSQIGDLVVDAIATGFAGGGTANAPSVGAGQTPLFSATAVGIDPSPSPTLVGLGFAASYEPGQASTAMSWSGFGSATDLAHVAVNIVQAAPTATNTTVSITSGELSLNDDDGGDNDYTLSFSSGTYTLTDPGNTIDVSSIAGATGNGTDTVTFPDTSITSITINANGGDDSLTVDFGGANPIPSGGIEYNGGGDSDELTLTGGSTTDITHAFTNASDGSITLAGAIAGTIQYTGLEPITDNMDADNRVFTLPNTANPDIVLSDAGTNNDGDIQLTGSTIEDVTFAVPNVSLAINGGTMADTISVQALDTNFDADLTIDGGMGTDAITFTSGPVDLGTGSLSSTAETTNLATNLQTDGGDVAITGGNVVLTASVQIDTESGDDDDAGDVDFTGVSLIESNAKGRDLTIDTSTSGGVGGNVTLAAIAGSGVNRPNDLVVDSRGTTDGVITVGGNISLNDDGAGNAATATISGDVRITGARSISTNDSTGGGGAIDLQNATVSATGAGFNLSLNSSNSGGTTANDITLGLFDATGGERVATLTVNAGSSGDVRVTDTVTLSGNLSVTAAAIDLGAGVTTTVDQSYTGPVTLSAPVVLTADDISLIGTVDNAGNLLTIDVSGTSGAANFAISGTGGLTKDGSGTFTLGGNSTYDGATTVVDGTLSVTGSLDAGGTVTVQNGGTLGGTGTIDRTVSVQSGGTLAPGTSPGMIGTGALTIASGGSLAAEIDGPVAGTNYDQVVVTGAVDIAGATLILSGSGAGISPSNPIVLINNDGSDAVTGTFTGLPEGAAVSFGAFSGIITYTGGDGNDVVLLAAGDVVYNAGAGEDYFELRQPSTGILEFLVGPNQAGAAVVDRRPLSIVDSFTINAGSGDDLLNVNYGAAGGEFALDITFNGQTQSSSPGDTLTISGGTADTMTFNATNLNDGNVEIDFDGGGVDATISYTGLEPIISTVTAPNAVFNFNGGSETITLSNATGANLTIDSTAGETVTFATPSDSLTVNGGSGDDVIDLSALASGVITTVTINGGDGMDDITGSQGPDVINGGDGDDTIVGAGGDDIIDGGMGEDTVIWNNGDGSDSIDGGGDDDTLIVNGSSVMPAGDEFTIAANGTRFTVTRADGGAGLGPFSLDVGTIEELTLNTDDGNDSVTVEQLSGVSDLSSIAINGENGDDHFDITPSQVAIDIDGGDPTMSPGDLLRYNGAATLTPAPMRGGTIAGSGVADVTFADIETPPSVVTIDQAAGQADPTNVGPIEFTATFSMPVMGFDNTDVDLSDSDPGLDLSSVTVTVMEISPMDGTTYSVVVDGMTGTGFLRATIPGNSVVGSGNLPSTSTDNSVGFTDEAPDPSPPDMPIVDNFKAGHDASNQENGSSFGLNAVWRSYSTTLGGYNGSTEKFITDQAGGATATYAFEVSPGTTYNILATWSNIGSRMAPAAKYDVYTTFAGLGPIHSTFQVDQRVLPDDTMVTDDRGIDIPFERLGMVTATTDVITVQLTDRTSGGIVSADAVIVTPMSLLTSQTESEPEDIPVSSAWHNQDNPYDVNDDKLVTPQDALVLVNKVNDGGTGPLASLRSENMYYDVSGNGSFEPLDAILVINHLNIRGATQRAEAENTFDAELPSETQASPARFEFQRLVDETVHPAPSIPASAAFSQFRAAPLNAALTEALRPADVGRTTSDTTAARISASLSDRVFAEVAGRFDGDTGSQDTASRDNKPRSDVDAPFQEEVLYRFADIIDELAG